MGTARHPLKRGRGAFGYEDAAFPTDLNAVALATVVVLQELNLNEGRRIPARTLMLSVVSDFPTGHGERDQCYRDHGGYRRIVDVNFFIPGSSIPAATQGFGAVFTDVDLPNTTSLMFFGVDKASEKPRHSDNLS